MLHRFHWEEPRETNPTVRCLLITCSLGLQQTAPTFQIHKQVKSPFLQLFNPLGKAPNNPPIDNIKGEQRTSRHQSTKFDSEQSLGLTTNPLVRRP